VGVTEKLKQTYLLESEHKSEVNLVLYYDPHKLAASASWFKILALQEHAFANFVSGHHNVMWQHSIYW